MKKMTLLALMISAVMIGSSGFAAPADSGLAALLPAYEGIRLALVHDSLEGVSTHAGAMSLVIATVEKDPTADRTGVPAKKVEEVKALLPELLTAVRDLEAASELEEGRSAFYSISKLLIRWRQAAGEGPSTAYCPMAKRSWLQPSDQAVGNPYLGLEMPTCGEIVAD